MNLFRDAELQNILAEALSFLMAIDKVPKIGSFLRSPTLVNADEEAYGGIFQTTV